VTDGEISASPAAAARTASASRAGPASLSRNPAAPARSAPYTYSSWSKVVTMTTRSGSRTCGPARALVTSSPSSLGIRISTRQTSGRSSRPSATASAPSAASPTTVIPG
jgi:hypothetical protein